VFIVWYRIRYDVQLTDHLLPYSVWRAASVLFFLYLLVVITAIDIELRIIPNTIIIVGIVGGVFFNIITQEISWLSLVLGGGIGMGFLLFTAGFGKLLFHKESIGFGDIKLGFLLGIFLGAHTIVVCLFAAFILALIIGGGSKVLSGGKLVGEIPFAPYLALGAVISILWGSTLENMYRALVGL